MFLVSYPVLAEQSSFGENFPVSRPEMLSSLGPVPIPSDNPQTKEKVDLGRILFFDSRLSGNGTMSCASCHLPQMGWGFADTLSLGYPGTVHWRNSQTIVNSAYYKKLFWDGSSLSLERQAASAAKGAVAGNGESDMMEARLAFVPEYRKRFAEIFGDTWPTIGNAWNAIAAFERTLVQRDTPFDRYMDGDDTALTQDEQLGLTLFSGKAGCRGCHKGPLLSDEKYYNIGVPAAWLWEEEGMAQITFRYELLAKGVTEPLYRWTKDDPGHYFITKQKADLGKFRTPSLRYTKYTAPYMHNGAFTTLDQVIDFYNAGGGVNEFGANKTPLLKPLGLTGTEKGYLKAFLLSLSGEPLEIEEPDIPLMQPLP
ncbi:cytochrome-c peroxidase [Kiloniella sp.]|uniref:cytochrome-c peroxidase n=1 Tax=Kiloniella sp. TaxID=1938587 RepID=UPI003B01658A